jgi:hypothetical protein
MAMFKMKQVVVEAITFDEFIEYGKGNGANIVNGMPWSFEYKGLSVTHENDTLYLIPAGKGVCYHFTPEDVLISNSDGKTFPLKKQLFESDYEKVEC